MPTASSLFEKLSLWISTSQEVDGLWVGTVEDSPYPGLRRVEQALELIKRTGRIQYARITRHLRRIWVNIVPAYDACYRHALNACVFDERFVVSKETTVERIAEVIIHEATHARLEDRGISYDEKLRHRIEAICLGRELAFARRLSDDTQSKELERTIDRCAVDQPYFSDKNFYERHYQGSIDALHFLGTPDWLVRVIVKLRPRKHSPDWQK